MSNQKDNRWYSAGDVCDRLKEMSQNHQDYLLIDCITENWEQAVLGISYALKRLEESKSLNAAAIPVNLGVNHNQTNEQGTLQTPLGELGTHWTSLVIRREPNCSFRAFYNDSLGAEMPPELRQILENHKLPITDLKYKQQFNGHDCGPWTVNNLDCLARYGRLDQWIIDQRNKLAKLKSEMPYDSENSSQTPKDQQQPKDKEVEKSNPSDNMENKPEIQLSNDCKMPYDSENSSQTPKDQQQPDNEVEKSKPHNKMPRRKSPPDDDDDNDNMLQTPNNNNYQKTSTVVVVSSNIMTRSVRVETSQTVSKSSYQSSCRVQINF